MTAEQYLDAFGADHIMEMSKQDVDFLRRVTELLDRAETGLPELICNDDHGMIDWSRDWYDTACPKCGEIAALGQGAKWTMDRNTIKCKSCRYDDLKEHFVIEGLSRMTLAMRRMTE